MKNRGYTSVELLAVLGIFTVAYFVTVFSIASNFDVDYEQEMYDQKILNIESMAAIYGESKKDEIFGEDSSIYMTVSELALENVIISGNDGVVVDPRDNEKSLNDLRVKITNEKNQVVAKVLS